MLLAWRDPGEMAINETFGGKAKMVTLVAAATFALYLLFLTQLLDYLSTATLGAVLTLAAVDLFNVYALRRICALRGSKSPSR